MYLQWRDELDLWFKNGWPTPPGVDLKTPPEIRPPELLSTHEA
jgi:hypothetical protein